MPDQQTPPKPIVVLNINSFLPREAMDLNGAITILKDAGYIPIVTADGKGVTLLSPEPAFGLGPVAMSALRSVALYGSIEGREQFVKGLYGRMSATEEASNE